MPAIGIFLASGSSAASPATAGGWSPMSLTNGEATPITLGQVCYLSANDTARLAQSDGTLAQASAMCICISASVAAAALGRFVFGGRVPGLSGGVVNAPGYLSATFGAIAATPNLAVGQYNVWLGLWLSATEFQFNPQLPIAN